MLIDLEVKRKSKEFSYDIIIIGAGASGITCANKINQLNIQMQQNNQESEKKELEEFYKNLDKKLI